MMPLRFTPQGGWSLVDGELGEPELGVYTSGMTACEPVFVHCEATQRVAMCHLDVEPRLDKLHEVIDWIEGSAFLPPVKILLSSKSDLTGSEFIKKQLQRSNCSLEILPVYREWDCGMTCAGKYLSEEALETLNTDDRYDPSLKAWWRAAQKACDRSNWGFISFQSPHRYLIVA